MTGRHDGSNKAATSENAPKRAAISDKRSDKKPEKKKKAGGNVFLSGLKNFGIVFILCLVIFGLLASLAVTLVTSAVDELFDEKNHLEEILNKDAEVVSTDADDLPEGESFTALVAVTDYDYPHYTYYPQGDDLTKLRWHAGDLDLGVLSAGYKTIGVKMTVLIRCDKDRREYTITPVSTRTRVFTSSGYRLLGDLYNDMGPQFYVQKVEALTGIGVDYFMFVNAREAPKIAAALGSFNVELSKDIYSDGAAFGTAERRYEAVTSVYPPETIPVETTPPKTDKDDKDDKDEKDTEKVTEKEPEAVTTEEEDDGKEPRTAYSLVVSAGTVTVTESNIQALLMFDDYENGVDDRLELEYELVKGALLRLASMSTEDRLKFYDEFALETPIVDCSPQFEEKEADGGETADENKDGDGNSEENKETKKKKKKNVIHGIFDDGKINTDMSRKSAELKDELIAAALRFNVKKLEFAGRFVNGYFAPNLTEATSTLAAYKLPKDPEKMVTVKGGKKN